MRLNSVGFFMIKQLNLITVWKITKLRLIYLTTEFLVEFISKNTKLRV